MERKSSRSKPKNSPQRKKKSSAKKPKVKLDAAKVAVCCSVILSLCVALLALTARLSSGSAREKPAVVTIKNPDEKLQEKQASQKKPIEKSSDTGEEKKASPKPETVSRTKTVNENKVKKNQPEVKHEPEVKTEPKIKVEEPRAVLNPEPKVTPKYNIPAASNGATLVIIIDDAGGSLENCRKYTSLPFPVAIAVLPKLAHSKECADLITASGKELMLHQPMQAINLNLNPGPGAILADMNTFDIARTVKANLDELGPGVKGLNNHEGSLITSNAIKIGTVLDVCNERGIYFLDSRTTKDTQAPQAALERDMTIFEKQGPYLDNVIDRDEMLNQLYSSLKVANKTGKAIIIGHVDKSVAILPKLLTDIYPELKSQGYRFAVPSMLKK